MNAITAHIGDCKTDIDSAQAEPSSENYLIGVAPALGSACGNLDFVRQRVVSSVAVVHHEMLFKKVLVLGELLLPFTELIRSYNVEIRRVRVVEGFAGESLFQVENYRAEGGYKITSTWFSKDAFLDNWDFVVARQSATRPVLDEASMSMINKSFHKIRTRELLLMSPCEPGAVSSPLTPAR
jgi:hypothetical protein